MKRFFLLIGLLCFVGCTKQVNVVTPAPSDSSSSSNETVSSQAVSAQEAAPESTVADSETDATSQVNEQTTTSSTEASETTKPLIIDVRSEAEWDTGHLAAAINIPHPEIADRIAEVAKSKDTPIFLHCRSGGRSGIAKSTLEELGYTKVENVGGLEDAKARFE